MHLFVNWLALYPVQLQVVPFHLSVAISEFCFGLCWTAVLPKVVLFSDPVQNNLKTWLSLWTSPQYLDCYDHYDELWRRLLNNHSSLHGSLAPRPWDDNGSLFRQMPHILGTFCVLKTWRLWLSSEAGFSLQLSYKQKISIHNRPNPFNWRGA